MSPYTGKIIPLSKLFTVEYEIEHIIPKVKFFDNSFSNKVICETNVNKLKDKQTAYEFIKNHSAEIVDLGFGNSVKLLSLEEFISHCKRYFRNNSTKLKKLLSEEIPDDFIERQLNDTRYISKFVKGLLSNIVRQEGEREVTSKNLISVTGTITSTLKNDWGLNDVWNKIIQPRFERLNKLTNSKDFGDWDYQKDENGNNVGKKFFRITVPDEISKGFNKKRIDHRHHSLDALVIACTNRKHIQYLNSLNNEKIKHELQLSLLIKNDKGHFMKQFKKPWDNFTTDVKDKLEKVVISFKQNNRIQTKATNFYWKWNIEDGKLKKKLVQQKKGNNRAIRKSLHTPLPYGKKKYTFTILDISKSIGKREFIVDEEIRVKIEELLVQFDGKIGDLQKYLKRNPITDNTENPISHTAFYITEERYRKRQPIQRLANRGQGGIKTSAQAIKFINKVSDLVIRKALLNHLKVNNYDIDKAFSIEGLEKFNNKRKIPIYRLPIAEASSHKFPLGKNTNTKSKFGEADEGTNLFFAIYWNEEKQKREYETIPLNKVIDHQKWRATLPKEKINNEPMIPINHSKGRFLFSLSPNDLIYIPTDEEIEYPHNIDFNNLTKEQANRIYKMVSCTGNRLYAIQNNIAKVIKNKFEFTSLNKLEFDLNKNSIKERCWKLEVNRLGNIIQIYK